MTELVLSNIRLNRRNPDVVICEVDGKKILVLSASALGKVLVKTLATPLTEPVATRGKGFVAPHGSAPTTPPAKRPQKASRGRSAYTIPPPRGSAVAGQAASTRKAPAVRRGAITAKSPEDARRKAGIEVTATETPAEALAAVLTPKAKTAVPAKRAKKAASRRRG